MSSREIAEVVEARHDNVKITIERLGCKGLVTFTATQEPTPGGGKPRTNYHVNKRDSYVIVAQLSPEFTARLVDRWQELEKQVAQPKVPQSFAEALRLAADTQEQLEQVEQEKQQAQQRVSTFNPSGHADIDMDIRVVDFDGEPWFVAVDIRECLGLTAKGNSHNYMRNLDSTEKTHIEKRSTQNTPLQSLFRGTASRVAVISESGLYKLVMRSDKPQARPFQDWVTKVVLPTIRKTACTSLAKKASQTGPLSLSPRRADRTGPPLPPCPASAP
ncbi:BRO family protein [Halomonas elongata]|uniref:BRO family protein n=1 Tax=Halomonas elongata TaxID=2746 RepID=UPI0023B0F330|nr:BRO family protein [Halomonas elongata]